MQSGVESKPVRKISKRLQKDLDRRHEEWMAKESVRKKEFRDLCFKHLDDNRSKEDLINQVLDMAHALSNIREDRDRLVVWMEQEGIVFPYKLSGVV